MNSNYLIPANSKKGKLIFNIFRGIDLTIFLLGVAITVIFFIAIRSDTLVATFIKVLPIGLGTFLVVPVANYHNVMCFIGDAIAFFMNRRVYKWRGWCVRSEFGED